MKVDAIAKDQINRRVTPTSLAFEWRNRTESNKDSDECMTTTHLGQLKCFIRSTGSQAPEAMTFAIENWQKFSSKVLKVRSPTYTSWFPDITFMCSHGDILLLCMNEKDSPCVQITKHSNDFPKPTSPVSEFEPKANIEDVKASLLKIAELTAKNQNT